MAIRFRKSIKIAPGVRVNIGKRGFTSVGAGKMNFGRRGVHYNLNIPGTGISYRANLMPSSRVATKGTTSAKSPGKDTKIHEVKVNMRLSDEGELLILDEKGRPVSENLATVVMQQNKQLIIDRLQEAADTFNGDIESLVRIHLTTPHPEGDVVVNPKPEAPKLSEVGIAGKLLGKVRERTEQNNKRLQSEYHEAMAAWQRAEEALRIDQEIMSAVLAGALLSLEWPRETSISFEVRNQGQLVMLDVDLPEIEEMPEEEAAVNRTQLRLNKRSRSAKAVRLEYLTHIHAIGFKLIGEVFAHLPTAVIVVLSGYSQRLDKSTAQITDQYLYSVRVSRHTWNHINFDKLEALDVVESFSQFELRRKATATGLLTPIQPFEG